jgi:transcriptional regulator with XRE-family HTH domain
MSRRKKIQQRLKQLQLSQRQLAQHAMLSCTVLNLWIDAKAVIPYNKLLRISDLLDLEPDDLVEIV